MNIATMRKLEQFYKRVSIPLEQVIFPLILLIWPLIKANQGIDVTDSTYSLSNYLYADRLDGVWIMSTYMSNLFGSLLVRLPGGGTLLGINIYTGLIISATALVCYYGLRREFTAPVMFAGEFLSISFCWIPSGILYNYLTYLLFNVTAILLYHAVKGKRSILFYAAGVMLGLNAFVRIPNVAETALIIAVWTGLLFTSGRAESDVSKRSSELIGMTGACVVGYVLGIAIPVVLIIMIYGGGSLSGMLTGLSGMSTSNSEYTLAAMLLSVMKAYLRSSKWVLIMLAVIFAGTLMMAVLKKSEVLKWLGRAIYIAVLGLMLRFFWGRGMYSYRFYEDYTSVYEWGMLLLILSWTAVIYVLVRNNYNPPLKTMAAITLVMLVVTPLGSNNYTMQNINNMFLVAPFTIYVIGGWLYRGTHRIRLEGILYGCNFPWMSMLLTVMLMVFLQSIAFHREFVFRDGMDGTPRAVRISGYDTLNGMYTNEYNAETLTGLCEYMAGETDIGSAIYWGDCPGLAYILRLPMAINTAWPNLESYTLRDYEDDLAGLREDAGTKSDTVIIWRNSYVAESSNALEKEERLREFIIDTDMSPVYENPEYTVYR